jgi:hypothetical protein
MQKDESTEEEKTTTEEKGKGYLLAGLFRQYGQNPLFYCVLPQNAWIIVKTFREIRYSGQKGRKAPQCRVGDEWRWRFPLRFAFCGRPPATVSPRMSASERRSSSRRASKKVRPSPATLARALPSNSNPRPTHRARGWDGLC